jgi:dipeptidyl aminopeptidase/acylaminoacyl peptidase
MRAEVSMRGSLLAVIVSVAAVAGAAPAGRGLTPEDVAGLPQVSDPRLSPAGDRVAFVVTQLRAPRERASSVWLVNVDGSGLTQVSGLEQARAPRWSPDGRTLAVIAPPAAGGAPLVHLYDPDARLLVALPETGGAREVAFAPSGRWLAVSRVDPETPRPDPVVVDEERPRHVRLWLVDRARTPARPLLKDDLTVWRFAWSPDSTRLAVLASSSPLAEGQEYGSRLLSVDVATGVARVLAERTCPQAAPAFSSDGRSVAFMAPLGAFLERGAIHVVPAEGGPAEAVAAAHAGTFWEVAWEPGRRRLLAGVGEGARHALARVGLDGAVTHVAPMRHSLIPLWEPVWSVDAAGRRVAFLGEAETGREIWTVELEGGEPRRLTRLTAPLEREVELGTVEAMRWTNPRDGATVEGILVSPAGAAPGARLPLVVWLHGGPAYHWGLGAHVQSWAHVLAGSGRRVLLPNFRGSTGYGQAWLTANVKDWGEGPMGDVMSGVDALVQRGLADPQRLYVGGGSYGGYLTYWIVGHTGRFRAAYLRAGISDPASGFALTDEPTFFAGYMGATPYHDPEVYRRLAPLGALGAVRTPLLIVHGERDARVPLMQSQLFHAGLRARGVPTRLVVYPREGHSIAEHDHQVDHLRRVLEWYARW